MSFGITVSRDIQAAHVVFTATLDTAAEALSTATYLAGETAGAAQKSQPAATEKKSQPAGESAKPTPEKQTLTASGNSGSSSIESKNDGKAAAGNTPAVLDYETDIKPLVLAIAKISREKAEGLLQRFGVASAKLLKPEQFAEFKEKAEQVIAGTYDPIASNEEGIA